MQTMQYLMTNTTINPRSRLSIVKLPVVGALSLFTFLEFAHVAVLTNQRAVHDLLYCPLPQTHLTNE